MKITPEKVIELVLDEYGFNRDELFGPVREQKLIDARALAMDLIHDRCGLSYEQVARMFNRSKPAAYSNSRNFRKRILAMSWQELDRIIAVRNKTFIGYSA